jgi:hypothetical protein
MYIYVCLYLHVIAAGKFFMIDKNQYKHENFVDHENSYLFHDRQDHYNHV